MDQACCNGTFLAARRYGHQLAIVSLQIQMSDVQSPPGNRISCARAGPHGSLPKSTKNRSFSCMPPRCVSQSISSIQEPCSAILG